MSLGDLLPDGWAVEGIETRCGVQVRLFLRRGVVLEPKWIPRKGMLFGLKGYWASKYRECEFGASVLAVPVGAV